MTRRKTSLDLLSFEGIPNPVQPPTPGTVIPLPIAAARKNGSFWVIGSDCLLTDPMPQVNEPNPNRDSTHKRHPLGHLVLKTRLPRL